MRRNSKESAVFVNDSKQGYLISWLLPLPGQVKLNTDGCFYDFNNKFGFGGVFRDSKASSNCSLEAEILAIYRGLTIILKQGMNNVKVG
ncbi:hypothetical protein RHMOL_Rhmol10G0226800 [Rhododendron molle]|uniref:Uncharacterized protein n=1 Tax=Rhododendron molle TaxID=49168 RepID=A0ACC0M6M4_RHOML|nr:hypothetical protein RHMOL_Rhmol10G0226800 [Rhododendron molle]